MTNRDNLICSMLNCGIDDLRMLDDIGYSWNEVLEVMDWPDDGAIDLNSLMRGVVDVGIIHIKEAVNDRICELKAILLNVRGLDEDEKKELKALESLNPDNDIQSYHNCINTNVWFEYNKEIYKQYIPDALESFKVNTGLTLLA